MRGLFKGYRRPGRAGFTLVELMITVAIVSILASVGFPALSRYISQSRTVEATGFLAEVKSRQESYRVDTGRYLPVSSNQEDFFPSKKPTGSKLQDWTPQALNNDSGPNWVILGAIPSGRTSRFVYSSVADVPGTTPVSRGLSNARGYSGADYWFITTARGDMNGDGVTMDMESYSHAAGIWCSVGNGVE